MMSSAMPVLARCTNSDVVEKDQNGPDGLRYFTFPNFVKNSGIVAMVAQILCFQKKH